MPWLGPPGAAAVGHLRQGSALPAVVLRSTTGEDVDLAAVAGRLLVYVYPWTGRPDHPDPPHWDEIPGAHGSTPQTEGFRDLHGAFGRAGITIFGVSAQSMEYQREFAARLRLPFAILSDSELRLQRALALPTFSTGGLVYLARLTLVIGDGLIERVHYPVADPAGHAAHMLIALAG